MKATFRFLALATVVGLTACGSTEPTDVNASSAERAVSAAAPAAPAQEEGAEATSNVKTTPLAELATTGDSVSPLAGPLKINATLFDNTVYVRPCGAPTVLIYDLNRAYTKLTTTVGVDDNAVDTDSATVTINADGATRSSVTARLGESTAVEVDLTDVLRLRVEIGGSTFCARGIGFGTNVGLGDAQLTPKS